MYDYYVFNGGNASTGSPNLNTGLLSYYGEILLFKSKKQAINYVNYSRSTGIVIASTKTKMRKYCQGMSTQNFNEYLKYLNYTENE